MYCLQSGRNLIKSQFQINIIEIFILIFRLKNDINYYHLFTQFIEEEIFYKLTKKKI